MKRSSGLDVLKGCCIILVVMTHLSWSGDERIEYLFPFWVDMAVPFFMLITGYLYARSFTKKGVTTFAQIYLSTTGGTIEKIVRYTLPFVIAWIVELFLFDVLHIRDIGPFSILFKEFLSGGVGPGSYYFPVLIQLVFVYPVVFNIIQNHQKRGLLICCLFNVIYELLQWAYGMNDGVYRLLVFRYICLVSFGCYFGLDGTMKPILSAVLFITGLICVYLNSYCGKTLFFITYWRTTSFLTTLHVVPVFYFIKNLNFHFKPLELLGKASYHIFLTQMVFYNFAFYIYNRISDRKFSYFVCVSICLLFGVLFYYVEKPIGKIFINWVHIFERKLSTNKGN